MTEQVIDKESAQAEFDRFVDLMDLDLDTATMDAEDRTAFEQQKRRVLKAIQTGALVINDNGEPVFTPNSLPDAERITFYEPTGATFVSMDRTKKNADVAKVMTMLGDMTKTAPAVFSRMKNRDFRVCQSLLNLFLT